jgi:hypothetical protein
MVDKTVAVVTMTANKILTNQGMLAGKHPGASGGLDTIVGRGRVPANFC